MVSVGSVLALGGRAGGRLGLVFDCVGLVLRAALNVAPVVFGYLPTEANGRVSVQ